MLRRSLLALLLAALPLFAAEPAPVNLDFESGAPGEVPPGWVSPTVELGYTAKLTTDAPKQGKQCVILSGDPRPNETMARPFGNVMQTVDATPYRGKRVRLRGAVRVEGEEANAALWLRVDRPSKQLGFFDNMGDRPIRGTQWAYYEINGDIEPDAETLNFGMMLHAKGSAWLDDVTIEILGKTEMRAGAPRALTPRGLENLTAFARLLGYVRHFHPSDESASADWNAIAIDGIDVVESAKNAAELASRLQDVFLPVAPSVRIFPSNAAPKTPLVKPAGAVAVLGWEHHGFGQQQGRDPYTSERIRRELTAEDARIADPLQPLRVDLGGGVSADVPLAVFADATHTLPAADRKPLPHSIAAYTGNDRATRLGDVILTWNVLQHFYPYFDVVDVNWPAELPTALRSAATDRDEIAFVRTMRLLIAALDDGHGNVQHASLMGRATPALLWRVIGDALVVTSVAPEIPDVHLGDEVLTIDGKPAMQRLRETEPLISGATPQWRRWVALREITGGAAGSNMVLTVRGADGATRTVNVPRAVRTTPTLEKRPEKIAEVTPGYWYVDLTRINDDDFKNALGKLAAARGIVYDMRGYPRMDVLPVHHAIESDVESARWNVPVIHRPGAVTSWDTKGRWLLDPQQPRLPKNVVYLTDARAISYAESWMAIVEAYKLAEIVGEPTAGTNGNINIVRLPGGYGFIFTGMKVLKHDGSRHHGVGIAPTVPVSPTLEGVRAGRDEQLEKALEILAKRAQP